MARAPSTPRIFATPWPHRRSRRSTSSRRARWGTRRARCSVLAEQRERPLAGAPLANGYLVVCCAPRRDECAEGQQNRGPCGVVSNSNRAARRCARALASTWRACPCDCVHLWGHGHEWRTSII
eukprot:493410-Prymnesium_polylepis.1